MGRQMMEEWMGDKTGVDKPKDKWGVGWMDDRADGPMDGQMNR